MRLPIQQSIPSCGQLFKLGMGFYLKHADPDQPKKLTALRERRDREGPGVKLIMISSSGEAPSVPLGTSLRRGTLGRGDRYPDVGSCCRSPMPVETGASTAEPPMAAVIEVRTYRATPGSRETLIEAMQTRATPAHREIGMKVLGPFPSTEDEDTFVWLRAFPDAESRDPMKESFYCGPLWLGELEPVLMPLIAHFESVLVEDSVGFWDSWPGQTE